MVVLMTMLHLTQLVITLTTVGHVIAEQHETNFQCVLADDISGLKGISIGQHTGIATRLQCAKICSRTRTCDVMQYCPEDKECALYGACAGCAAAVNMSTACPNTNSPITARIPLTGPALTCGGGRLLVTGRYGVADSQLSASSYWCQSNPVCVNVPDGHTARWGRLDSTGMWGAWCPKQQVLGEYIQVDFLTMTTTLGVVLTGRAPGCCGFYVTAFKVLHSNDCVTFTQIIDHLGNDKIFPGISYPEEVVTRCFDGAISARCIRLAPTAWFGADINLRFDVLGI